MPFGAAIVDDNWLVDGMKLGLMTDCLPLGCALTLVLAWVAACSYRLTIGCLTFVVIVVD